MSLDRLSRLREYKDLEKRKLSPGLTPLEYHRWLDLRPKQAQATGGSAICLLVEVETFGELGRYWMTGLAGGGLFVPTPFVAEVGTEFSLAVLVKESGDRYVVYGVVASHNVGEGFSTRDLGMGIRFRPKDEKQQACVSAMRAAAGVLDS